MDSENVNESSDESNELSSEKNEILIHFREIAEGIDREQSLELLRNADWNLEVDLTPINQRIVQSSPEQSWFFYGLKFLLFPLTLSYRFIVSLSRVLYVVDPVGDVKRFISFYKEKYCSNEESKLPPFYSGSYAQALSDAKQSLRFLIVYLHGETHEDTDKFCKKTLSDNRVLEFLNNSSEIILWGCDVDSPEGYRVSRVFRENTYPFIGIIGLSFPGFASSKVMALLGRIEGAQTSDSFVSQISSIIADNSGVTQAARIEREELRVNAEIRKEQDQAYEQSLAADRAKKLEKIAKDNQLLQEKKEEENRRNREEKLRLARKLRSQKYKKFFASYKPAQGAESVKLSMKLPSSERITCEFDLDDSVKLLYYKVISECDDLLNFSIKSNFPQRQIECDPSAQSDIEDYAELVGLPESEISARLIEIGKFPDHWRATESERARSFRDNQLIKPEILLVIDNDA